MIMSLRILEGRSLLRVVGEVVISVMTVSRLKKAVLAAVREHVA